MTIKFIKEVPAEAAIVYKKGDTVENADAVFGPAQAAYFVETGYAEFVGVKTEKAVAPKAETPEK